MLTRPQPLHQGFTLMELLFVVILIAILATFALPAYHKSMERRYWHQAREALYAIYAGERAYFFAADAYFDPGDCDPANLVTCDPLQWQVIHMDIPAAASVPVMFTVTVTLPPTPTFTATATHTVITTKSMTINQTNTLDISAWPYP